MSTLQLSLIVIGVLVLAAVMAYNAWVTRRSTSLKAAQREINAPAGADGGQRIEPMLLDGEGGAVAPTPNEAGDTVPPLPNLPLADKRLGLDLTDRRHCPLDAGSRRSGDAVLAALPRSRRVGTKPFAVEGSTPPAKNGKRRGQANATQALQAGVQLANRSGALNEIEFSEQLSRPRRLPMPWAPRPSSPRC